MIQKIYSQDFHLDCFLLDHEGKASLVTYFNLMQEVALKHAMILGFGKKDMEALSMFWVLTRMGLIIKENKKWDDVVTVTTWSRGLDGAFSFREFIFTDKNGIEFGHASSSWVPLDLNTRRPARILDPELINGKSLPDKNVELELLKLSSVKKEEELLTSSYLHIVKNTDLDINAHANNARYVEWIYNSTPLDFFSSKKNFEFQINYLGEAKLHDQIEIKNNIHLTSSETQFLGIETKQKKNIFAAKFFNH